MGGPLVDAIVIGAGPNGLAAANLLADHGWDVLVLEEQGEPGGAVRSGRLTVPGYTHDLFSAFYPFAAASPVFASFELEAHGLRWRRAPVVLAHPLEDACAALHPDLDGTAASLEAFAPGDGDAWRELHHLWRRAGPGLLDAVFTPFPPLRAGARLGARLGPRGALELARLMSLTARRLADERFGGAGGGLLLTGNALHTDLGPDSAGGAAFGWILCALGQQHGFPVPEGGAGRLTEALVRRLRAAGGELRCGERVTGIVVRGGRAAGVRTGAGRELSARRAVLADVSAPQLYLELVGADKLPRRLADDLRRFQWDAAVVKVDWALRAPIPWRHEDARRAGTLHVGEGMDALTLAAGQLQAGLLPEHPFLVMGQYAGFDHTRQPPGAETAWAYTHVPQRIRADAAGELAGNWEAGDGERFADRVEREIERLAPGFRELVAARHVFTPPRMETANRNLAGGALNGGTAQLHQQAIFRPTPGLGRPETPLPGLYLASASAHPGGSVHGAPGANAAHAALLHSGPRRLLPQAVLARRLTAGRGGATRSAARR